MKEKLDLILKNQIVIMFTLKATEDISNTNYNNLGDQIKNTYKILEL